MRCRPKSLDRGTFLWRPGATHAAYAGRRYQRLVYAPRALIVADGAPLDFHSEECGQQGDPCVCADYAFATHEPNADLGRRGGAAAAAASRLREAEAQHAEEALHVASHAPHIDAVLQRQLVRNVLLVVLAEHEEIRAYGQGFDTREYNRTGFFAYKAHKLLKEATAHACAAAARFHDATEAEALA